MAATEDGFLSRWSRRKERARAGVAAPEPQAELAAAATPAVAVAASIETPPVETQPAEPVPAVAVTPPPPAPTLADVAELTRSSDFSRFVTPSVAPEVKNAALKKLFTDPHFNVMDGLDTYIADYGKPDPLPAGMLRQMVQSKMLGLFDDEPGQAAAAGAEAIPAPSPAVATSAATPCHPAATAAALPPPDIPTDEDPDLQLQPDDATGCSRPDAGPEPDAGRQH